MLHAVAMEMGQLLQSPLLYTEVVVAVILRVAIWSLHVFTCNHGMYMCMCVCVCACVWVSLMSSLSHLTSLAHNYVLTMLAIQIDVSAVSDSMVVLSM